MEIKTISYRTKRILVYNRGCGEEEKKEELEMTAELNDNDNPEKCATALKEKIYNISFPKKMRSRLEEEINYPL